MSEAGLLVTRVGLASGARELAAAVACACSAPDRPALLVDLDDSRRLRPTPIATAAARALEERLADHLPEARVAARGSTCHLVLSSDRLDQVAGALALVRESAGVLHVPPDLYRRVLSVTGIDPKAVLLRADLEESRALTALVVRDAIEGSVPVAVLKRAPGWFAGRRAMAGLPSVGGRGAMLSPACGRVLLEANAFPA